MPPGGNSQVAAFTARALVATFTGVSGFAVLAGPLLLATLAVVVWRPAGRLQAAFIALATTTVLMFAGIGVQRVGLGLQLAESSRYVYMGAMLLAPMIAVAIDRIAVVSSSGLLAARLLLVASVFLNIGSLLSYGSDWARRSACDRGALQFAGRRAGPHRADPRHLPATGVQPGRAPGGPAVPRRRGRHHAACRRRRDADEALIQAALKQPSVACPSAA